MLPLAFGRFLYGELHCPVGDATLSYPRPSFFYSRPLSLSACATRFPIPTRPLRRVWRGSKCRIKTLHISIIHTHTKHEAGKNNTRVKNKSLKFLPLRSCCPVSGLPILVKANNKSVARVCAAPLMGFDEYYIAMYYTVVLRNRLML